MLNAFAQYEKFIFFTFMSGVFIWCIGITQLINVRGYRRGNKKKDYPWTQDTERKQKMENITQKNKKKISNTNLTFYVGGYFRCCLRVSTSWFL